MIHLTRIDFEKLREKFARELEQYYSSKVGAPFIRSTAPSEVGVEIIESTLRDEIWNEAITAADNGPGQISNPQNVQFCGAGRGRIQVTDISAEDGSPPSPPDR